MDHTINLITAPDMIFNNTFSMLLIHPSNDIKKQLETFLITINKPINIYLYDQNTDDIKWLLSVIKQVNIVIIETDNIASSLQPYISYILSMNNVWYKSDIDWSLINRNKFFDFPPIQLKET
jgi:hypothetical protein